MGDVARRALVTLGAALAACGRIGFDPLPGAAPTDAPMLPVIIYATDSTALYSIDPVTRAETRLATLSRADSVVVAPCDVAVDAAGTIFVADQNLPELYRVDPATGNCAVTMLSPAKSLLGTTYVPPGVLDPDHEVLVGASADQNLYTVDPGTGAMTLIGPMGARVGGDLVWTGSELIMTVGGTTVDVLYRIDIATGQSTPIGDTGFVNIYGMARVGNTIFGLLETNGIVTIDPATGIATVVKNDAIGWTGASAPDG
jgi:hypothetical protein